MFAHSMGRRPLAYACLAAWVVLSSAGCALPRRLQTEERYAQGVVYILPGIEGQGVLNQNIAFGLEDGGVASAIEIYDWTTGAAPGFLYHLTAYERNLKKAQELADKIVAYREQHPGRPVHIVGHSGGGGMAVLALEALPEGRKIDAAILLGAAISPGYNLSDALRRTQALMNFYSRRDVGFLKVGTSVFGPIDREPGSAAGAVGFQTPPGLDDDDVRIYKIRLKQVAWGRRLSDFGANGSHTGWASRKFAKSYLSVLIRRNEAARPLPAAYFER